MKTGITLVRVGVRFWDSQDEREFNQGTIMTHRVEAGLGLKSSFSCPQTKTEEIPPAHRKAHPSAAFYYCWGLDMNKPSSLTLKCSPPSLPPLLTVCQSCVELDTATLVGILVTDIVVTLLLALGVYCFAGHETGRLYEGKWSGQCACVCVCVCMNVRALCMSDV